MGDLTVNTEARLWGPYKELEKTINAAIHKKIPDAVHDLEVALKQHKPNFISLLKNPAKGTLYRDAVKKSVTAGLQVQGEQATQTFSSQFIEEALIISDLFDMNEIAVVELLMAGERKQSEFPGLSRGLVAVLLYYDGQRSLVNALRTLLQSREGRTWTMELTPDLANIVTQFTDQLITKDGIINKILDLISNMDWINEMDKLQAERAIGPPKHRKQVTDIYKEIKLILADCLFCLACQQPLDKTNTKRLISHLRSAVADTADGVLDLVNLSLTMTLLYCFDVSVLEQEDASDTIKNLPFIKDTTYVPEIHQEITSPLPWATSGIQALVRFAWGLVLRQLSQYQVPTGYNEILEDEEVVIDMALETNVFHFLHTSVVAVPEFHSEEFYLRRLHGMITDFISNMPLKVKELRNRGDEIARVMISQNVDLLDTSVTAQKGFEYLLRMIGDMYKDDPLGLGLSMEYWGPSETQLAHETTYNYRPPQKQVTLYKFVRSAGDLLPAALYLPYIYMLRGLSANQQSAQSCFDLLKLNGISTGPATSVSWNHIFHSLTQYYEELRREAPTNSESSQHSRAPPLRGITAIELEGLIAVLRLTRVIAEKNEICRVYLFENQQWSCIMVLFGLITCSVPQSLKAELFLTLAAFAKSHDIAAALWQTLEASQILPTVSGSKLGGIHVELDEIESRNEEYPMLRGFLQLMNALTDIPVPAGLGAGLRAPGFDPYLFFLKDNVFQRFSSRGYKNPEEKWEVASSVLNILVKLLKEHEVAAEDFIDEVVELQSGGTTTLNKNPGHTLLIYMLNDSNFLKMVLRIIDEAINQLELYTDFPGKSAMEKAALQSLKMIEYSLEKADTFATLCRETGASVMIVSMDRLLLGINTRTGKPDHLVNIAKYVTFGTLLPFHTQSAMKILLKICQSAPVQSEMLNLFTVDSATKLELLNGFVECLEVDCVETHVPDNIIFQGEEEPEEDTNHVRNLTRQNLLHILLHAIEQPGTNLAHFLLGFELRKPVSKTNLQDPGILGSPRTCLHAILNLLEQGVDTPSGPTCLLEIPTLAELCYKLIYLLCANKDTSIPTLRYLRTTRDFLCKQLQHLPFSQKQHVYPVGSHQSWLLYTVAVELRITSLNRQRSYTQRVIRLLLDDNLDADEMTSMGMGDEETAIFDRMGDSSFFQSAFGRRQTHLKGKQNRRKLLSLLDAIEFSQKYPEPLALEIFEPERIEKVIQATEKKGPDGVVYCNVQQLHKILTMELNSHQGTVVASQRQRILQEVSGVLRNVVARNKVRRSLHTKQRAFDAWRQVAEILLTACPEDHLTKDNRRQILFELLHDLLQKVSDDNTLTELTAPVAGSILTLTANLCQSFTAHAASSHQSPDTSAGQGQNVAWGEGSMSGSRTLHATSLQLVLKGLVEYMMKSSGGLQRVRANLYGSLLYYLQIAQKPKSSPETFVPEDEVGGGVGNRVLASSDSEYELLCKENVNTLLAYGDSFMDMVCRDACDGHDVGRMLALSVMDTILSMDKFQQWMTFMSGKGYLQHLVDSLLHDDAELQTLMSSSPELRVLYIYESKMSLLTRVAESAVGAHTLLRCGVMQRLAACSFFDMRPDLDRSREVSFLIASEDFLPSPMARYQQVLFASLKLCLAVLTSLGIENQDAGNQVLQFIFAHGEVFHNILRDRQPSLNIQALKELALTTAVISRANYKGLPDVEFDGLETASIEFRAHKTRIERQMIALMPRYCFSEKLIKQLRNTEHQDLGNGQDLRAEMSLAYQEIAANVTSFCRSVVSTSGYTSQFCRVLFGPSLEEALARDIRSTDELSFSMGPSQTPNLGIVVFQLRQCTNQFMSVYDAHQTHLRKLQSVTDLSTEDLKEFAGVSATEKVSSHQKQLLARKRLSQIVHYKGKELKYLSYIIENCLFVLWRHLEFYLLHCIPVDQQPSLYQAQIRRQHQLRRLQDITGASSTSLNESGFGNETELDEVSRGVTREEIANLKQTAMSAITESMLKKLQEINQSFCQNRTHFGFVEALIRRTKRLLRLHTSS